MFTMFSESASQPFFCSVLPQLTSLITKRVAPTTALALCTSLLHQRRRRRSTFSNIPHACWRVFLRRRLSPLSLLTRFLHVPFSSHANVHLFQREGGGGARARWLTCSEPMLGAHFDMTFKNPFSGRTNDVAKCTPGRTPPPVWSLLWPDCPPVPRAIVYMPLQILTPFLPLTRPLLC